MKYSAQNNRYDREVVHSQLSRTPRDPWRVGARCHHGYPTVIVSPSLLDDGARFPNWGYLTCPFLCSAIGHLESEGAIATWADRLEHDEKAAQNQRELEVALKQARLDECRACNQTEDVCASVGIAGQKNTLGVKCLHIHVAYALLGLDDGIGREVLRDIEIRHPFGCTPECGSFEACSEAAHCVALDEMKEESSEP